MTANYTRDDVSEQVEQLIPKPHEDSVTQKEQRYGSGLRKRVLSLVSQLFTSDPESILSLMKLAADRVVQKSQ